MAEELPAGWLKGQLHLHSNASGDSQTPAEDVVRWYETHGYDFIVFTDHNRVTHAPSRGEMLVLEGVEITQNLARCEPPPDAGDACLLHVNALVVEADRVPRISEVERPVSAHRLDHFRYAMELSKALGGIAQLNHPNFHYAATQEDLFALTRDGLTLFEVANEAWDSNNSGGSSRPSTVEMWDFVLRRGGRLFGTATDDAHHYYDARSLARSGQDVFPPDRGFVMVRADRTPAEIRTALAEGKFYASTGVVLDDVVFRSGVLEVQVAASTASPFEVRFVADGAVVGTSSDSVARMDAVQRGYSYLRATVIDAKGRKAWVQPVFVGAERPGE